MRRFLCSIAVPFVLLVAGACGDSSAPSLGDPNDPSKPGNGNGNDGGTTPDGGGNPGACSSSSPATSTSGVACSYAHDAYNSSASVKAQSTVQWGCTSDARTIKGNGIPDHATGTFPNANCPNGISAQTVDGSMPIAPVDTGKASTVPFSGYALNGVKFDPSTAGSCSDSGSCSLIGNSGTWQIEALGQSKFDFGVDENNAHVQPNGWYHYHGMPEGLIGELGKGTTPTLIGFAVDGFPVYARYGYTTPMDASSDVKVVTSSYQLKKAPDANRPSTSTYPMGAFTQDYEYVAGSGDLDECNGRIDVTPEFPCGIYHYYVTETYPFIQRCVRGTAQLGPGPGPGPGGDDCGGCTSGNVCCPTGQPCAGQCVPDCRQGGGTCPSGLTCDANGGFCHP